MPEGHVTDVAMQRHTEIGQLRDLGNTVLSESKDGAQVMV